MNRRVKSLRLDLRVFAYSDYPADSRRHLDNGCLSGELSKLEKCLVFSKPKEISYA